MTKIHELTNLGQAIWFDYIRRSFITSGELQKLLDQGVRGVTSNPSIFEKAIRVPQHVLERGLGILFILVAVLTLGEVIL